MHNTEDQKNEKLFTGKNNKITVVVMSQLKKYMERNKQFVSGSSLLTLWYSKKRRYFEETCANKFEILDERQIPRKILNKYLIFVKHYFKNEYKIN